MNNIEMLVRFECPSCEGDGVKPNPDYDEKATFPEERFNTCMECSGNKTVQKWVRVQVLMDNTLQVGSIL